MIAGTPKSIVSQLSYDLFVIFWASVLALECMKLSTSICIKAKFHYAIWLQTDSKLVADLLVLCSQAR